MIKRFQRKQIRPNNIQAIQFEDTAASFAEIRKWVGDRFYYNYQQSPYVFLTEKNDNGNWPVYKGYWIVKDEEGNFEVYASIHMDKFEEIK